MEDNTSRYEISRTEAPKPKTTLAEKTELLLNPRLQEIRREGERLKKAGVDKETVDAVVAISLSAQKVVEACTVTNSHFGKEFSAKFKVSEDGNTIEKVGEMGFIRLKTPKEMLKNFVNVAVDEATKKDPEWFISQGLENLTGWISLAAEVNPQMVYNLRNEVDYKRFGIKGERTFAVDRPKVNPKIMETDFKTVPETELPEGVKKLREAVTAEFGPEFSKRILLCGGTARDVVLGKDPTKPYDGDFDYAIVGDLSEEDHNKLEALVKSNINNRTDDLTGPYAPYQRAMQDVGAKDVIEMLEIDREFSVNKFAINLGNREIIDPYGGVKDLNDGILKLVGKNIDDLKVNELFSGRKPGEALILAIRGARFASQYGLKIEDDTAKVFHESMKVNETSNRFAFQFFGPNRAEFQSDISKGYLKMLEKTQDAEMMMVNLAKMGVLHQFAEAIDVLNFQTQVAWGVTLRTFGEMYAQKDWQKLVDEAKLTEDPNSGLDIRGKEVIEPKQGLRRFFGLTMATARMASYLAIGV